jgi:hypothetical protein
MAPNIEIENHAENFLSPFKKSRGLKGAAHVLTGDLAYDARKMVNALTDDEKEHAARANFGYLWRAVVTRELSPEALIEERDYAAALMALRHLKSKKGDTELAMEKLRNAIQFRKDFDLDGLRLCFHANEIQELDEETKERYAIYRAKLEDRMTTGRVYVSGHDKHGRAIYTIHAARTKDFDREWFLKESLYNFERAIAATEHQSGGREQSITVIGNYTGFTSKHGAPMSISHEFMDILRQNYPGRVNRVYLLNTPTSFLFFWSILKPFIGTDTRKKIHFVNSEKQREKEFGEMVSLDQAAPWMLKNGKNTREFDSNEYLHNIPFHKTIQTIESEVTRPHSILKDISRERKLRTRDGAFLGKVKSIATGKIKL